MLSGRIWRTHHFERLDSRGGLIFPKLRPRLAHRRARWTAWRPATCRSMRPCLVRSSLSLPGPNPHRDHLIRTQFPLSGNLGWPSVGLSSARPHLPQTSRGRAVALDSRQPLLLPTPCQFGEGQPPDRSGTPNAEEGAAAFNPSSRTYPAHGARHRNKKKTEDMCPDSPGRGS
jgi:hypothetical protein